MNLRSSKYVQIENGKKNLLVTIIDEFSIFRFDKNTCKESAYN